MDKRWERGGLLWPVLLVLAGIVLLLNNTGQLDWTIWELLLRLWPAILVAAGIDLMIPRRSAYGHLLALALILGVFLGSYWLISNVEVNPEGATTIDEALEGSRAASLVLDSTVGELRLHAGAPDGSLAFGSTAPGRVGRIEVDRSKQGDRAVLVVAQRSRSGYWLMFPDSTARWDLAVSSQIPLDLDASLGVGSMDLDLTGLEVEQINAEVGVGQIELRLSEAAGAVSIEGGVGQLRIVLPAGASARIHISRGLSALQLPAGYRYANGIASSPSAQRSSPDFEIRVDLGVGLIAIVERGR